jgi:hypothetical protein
MQPACTWHAEHARLASGWLPPSCPPTGNLDKRHARTQQQQQKLKQQFGPVPEARCRACYPPLLLLPQVPGLDALVLGESLGLVQMKGVSQLLEVISCV